MSAVKLFPPKGSDSDDDDTPLEIADGDEDDLWELFAGEEQPNAETKKKNSASAKSKRKAATKPKARPAKRARKTVAESADQESADEDEDDLDDALEDLAGETTPHLAPVVQGY